jgi:hypothetical protein
MTVNMVAHIVFPAREGREKIEIRKITGVQIETGWEMMTSTATIILARNVSFFDKNEVKEVFQPGDKVEIYLGYDFTYLKEFEGYITQVSAEIPIKIKCEDAMYLLKRTPANVSLKETTVKELLEKIMPGGFKTDAIDAEIGTVRYANTTVSQILEKVKQDFGFYSYIKNWDTLVVGKIYQDDEGAEPVKFSFAKNVVGNNLEYKTKEEVLIKIKAVSTLRKGDKIEVEYGDDGGVMKQLPFYGIKVKAELEKLAKIDYDKFKVDGFNGDFEAFGMPSVTHGMTAELEDPQYPDKNGKYWIKKVVKTFDDTPKYRQKITLDQKRT